MTEPPLQSARAPPQGRTPEEADDHSLEPEWTSQKRRKVNVLVAAGKAAPSNRDTAPEAKSEKTANPLGEIIGRKRKERRAKGRA